MPRLSSYQTALLVLLIAAMLAIGAVLAPATGARAQSSGPQATVLVSVANVRSGPGTNFPVVGQLRQGGILSLSGRNAANSWWYGCCVNGRNVWIASSVARASGGTASLPIAILPVSWSATPTPTPTPVTFPEWKGEYFNDVNLAGSPLLVRNDSRLDFNWGLGSPGPGVPQDNFSVRWTRSIDFTGGNYTFYARTSDGVRIYLDNLRVLNEWHDTEGYPTYAGRFYDLGAGWHTVTVEYYERGGIAYATVWWEPLTGAQ